MNQERLSRNFFRNGVKSSEGYTVYFNSQQWIEIRDGKDRFFLSAELLATDGWAIYPENITVGTPDGPDLLNEKGREKVLARVQKAAAFAQVRLVIPGGPAA